MVMRVLSDGLIPAMGRFMDIVQGNEAGVEYMREMFEKKAAE